MMKGGGAGGGFGRGGGDGQFRSFAKGICFSASRQSCCIGTLCPTMGVSGCDSHEKTISLQMLSQLRPLLDVCLSQALLQSQTFTPK